MAPVGAGLVSSVADEAGTSGAVSLATAMAVGRGLALATGVGEAELAVEQPARTKSMTMAAPLIRGVFIRISPQQRVVASMECSSSIDEPASQKVALARNVAA